MAQSLDGWMNDYLICGWDIGALMRSDVIITSEHFINHSITRCQQTHNNNIKNKLNCDVILHIKASHNSRSYESKCNRLYGAEANIKRVPSSEHANGWRL